MNTRLAASAAVVLAIAGGARGQLSTSGEVQFPMLRMSYSAREIAMAGASIAMPSELFGFHSNPAALGYVSTWQAVAGYRSLVLDLWSGMVAVGGPIRNTGFWSFNVINLSEGDVEEVINENGFPVETGTTWNSNNLAGSISWSKVLLKTLSLGASLKLVYRYSGSNSEYYSSDGLALDLGIQYRMLSDRVIVGAVGRNLGFVRSGYTDDLDKGILPIGFGLGVTYVPRYVKPLRVALDVEKSVGAYIDIQPGIEITIIRDILCIRAGYAFSQRELEHAVEVLNGTDEGAYDKAQWNRFCFGAGLNVVVRDIRIGADAALELNTVSEPCVAVSILTGF